MDNQHLVAVIVVCGFLAYALPSGVSEPPIERMQKWSQAATRAQPPTGPNAKRITEISFGQPISLEDWLYPGKVTIFDFFSQGCPPCRKSRPMIEKIVEANENVALQVVNINRPEARGIDFSSPVATQQEIRSVPHFIIYDAAGQRQMEGSSAYEFVIDWVNECLRSPR